MKALLKNGQRVEIDTSCLFRDQYNTVDGKRIYDGDIRRIIDDARIGMGKCKYCGALVKRGEEEAHFAEREAKPCETCWWYRDKLIGTDTHCTNTETQELDGSIVSTTVRTTVYHYRKQCASTINGDACANTECRRYGVDWFTPDNTFFLAYPDGFSPVCTADDLLNRGFVSFVKNRMRYPKAIGSYELTATVDENREVCSFTVWNCRRIYTFRYHNGKLFTNDSTFGWTQVPTLDGVPVSVMRRLEKICAFD